MDPITERARRLIDQALAEGAEKLDLSAKKLRGQLSELPETTSQLQQLTSLNLRSNRLAELPETIGQLRQLTNLNLRSNRLSELPATIGQLRQLTSLDLSLNRLSALPETIGQLQQLTHLNLRGNQLSELPESIGQLQQLTYLYLGGNQLAELPESIGQLRQTEDLDLKDNQLSDLPDGIGDLSNLRELELDGNLLPDSLAAAAVSGPDALREYLRTRGIRLYEAKLLIVGEARAGKTSLARKLVDPAAPLPGPGESTLGIQVHRNWTFPYASGPQASEQAEPEQEMSANIWDFGGQEIQYATHQFFLTPSALYVLVADARRRETDYDYWFNIIRLLGQERVPSGGEPVHKTQVLVLLHEKANRQVTDFDLGTYRRRFPELTIETAEADLANLADGRVQALRIRIQRMLSALPHVGERQPVAWRPVRVAVEDQCSTQPRNSRVPVPHGRIRKIFSALFHGGEHQPVRGEMEDRQGKHHLSFEQFRGLCAEQGIQEERDARVLLRYLNFVGVCVYFDQDPLLKDFIITDPQWAVNALYRVLDRDKVQDRQGHLSRGFFHKVLTAEGYQEHEIDRLFLLLQKDRFEICFPLEGNDGELHIVPQLIPHIAPDYNWKDKDNLHFEYQYPFMPKGLLARLIVRLHESLDKDKDDKRLIWREGAVLRSQDARAELVETKDPRGGKVLRLRVAGPVMARRALLAVVRHEIGFTHKRSFSGLEVNQRVPCNCPVCAETDKPRMYDYRELEKYVSGGRGVVYCPEGQVDVSISAMLEGLVDTADAQPSAASDGETEGADKELERLSEGDSSSLVKLLSASRQAPVQIINMQQANPEQHQHTHQETNVSVEVRIEQKNQVCNELGGLFDNLAADAEKSTADAQEIARLKQELDKAQEALESLEENRNPDDKKAARGPLQRLKGFVEGIADAETGLGKLVGAIDGGRETARKAFNLYNVLGPLFGMPPIPNPILKASSD